MATVAEYKAMIARTKTAKAGKYHAIPTAVDGIRFPSKREANRYVELKRLQQAGEIAWFIRQPCFDLPGGVKARFDFLVVYQDGHIGIEDAKGTRLASFKRNKKQVEAWYPVEIVEV